MERIQSWNNSHVWMNMRNLLYWSDVIMIMAFGVAEKRKFRMQNVLKYSEILYITIWIKNKNYDYNMCSWVPWEIFQTNTYVKIVFFRFSNSDFEDFTRRLLFILIIVWHSKFLSEFLNFIRLPHFNSTSSVDEKSRKGSLSARTNTKNPNQRIFFLENLLLIENEKGKWMSF